MRHYENGEEDRYAKNDDGSAKKSILHDPLRAEVPVKDSLQTLSLSINDLDNSLRKLYDKLSPVLLPIDDDDPTTMSMSAAKTLSSPLVEEIRSYTDWIERITRSAAAITERVEL